MEKIYDQYGKALKKGQKVVVAVTGAIACRGKVTAVDVERKEAYVELTWPEGNTTVKCCKYYGVREGSYYLSEIVVV